jgi:hypothetical protein
MKKNCREHKKIKINAEFSVGFKKYRRRKYICLSLLPEITFIHSEFYYQIEIKFLYISFYVGCVNFNGYEYLISKNKQS